MRANIVVFRRIVFALLEREARQPLVFAIIIYYYYENDSK